jgi:hypothetical protein
VRLGRRRLGRRQTSIVVVAVTQIDTKMTARRPQGTALRTPCDDQWVETRPRCRSGGRRVARSVAVVFTIAGVAASGGCGAHAGEPGTTRICGSAVWSGADAIGVTTLGTPTSRWTGRVPSRSELPPRRPSAIYSLVAIVQVSNSCKTGRVVVVTGATGAAVTAEALASDRQLAGFTFGYPMHGPTIVIRAFLGKRQIGEVVINR